MTSVKSGKDHWYYHEIIICTGIALGIFGLMFIIIKSGVSIKVAALIGAILFVGFILIPLIDPIQDLIRWIRKHRSIGNLDNTTDKELDK